MDANNVSFGKPKATGAVYIAPKGTTLPTNATTTLAGTYINLGYVSEDGLVNETSTDTEEVNAWGGQRVLVGQTTYGESFTFNLLETKLAALQAYYGEANVTESAGVITVKANNTALPQVVLVFELVLTGGRIKRIVVPAAQMTDRSGEISYVDGEPVAYPMVFNAYPDAQGNTHTEYIAAAA